MFSNHELNEGQTIQSFLVKTWWTCKLPTTCVRWAPRLLLTKQIHAEQHVSYKWKSNHGWYSPAVVFVGWSSGCISFEPHLCLAAQAWQFWGGRFLLWRHLEQGLVEWLPGSVVLQKVFNGSSLPESEYLSILKIHRAKSYSPKR